MTKTTYNLLTLLGFLMAAIGEFITRDSGGFTLTALIFYGIFHLILHGIYLFKQNVDDERADVRDKRNR